MSSSTTSGTTDLAATYAALILADADVEITAPKILAITTAANVEIEPIWATLLAKALEGKNVKEMAVGVAGAPATRTAGQVTGKPEVQELAEAPAEDQAPDSDEDSDDNLFGGGLFD